MSYVSQPHPSWKTPKHTFYFLYVRKDWFGYLLRDRFQSTTFKRFTWHLLPFHNTSHIEFHMSSGRGSSKQPVWSIREERSNHTGLRVIRLLLPFFIKAKPRSILSLYWCSYTMWKTIWGRFRSRCSDWRQWAFAICPDWTPLAASLFANMNDLIGPPNLVFDRLPEGSLSPSSVLTHLNSGATHSAQNIVLQNMWHIYMWYHGPRK